MTKYSNGLDAMLYSPNTLSAKVGRNKTNVSVNEETGYPFWDEINFTLSMSKSLNFQLDLRIPSWCRETVVMINGKKVTNATGGTMISLNRNWKNNDKITLQLPMKVIYQQLGKKFQGSRKRAFGICIKNKRGMAQGFIT